MINRIVLYSLLLTLPLLQGCGCQKEDHHHEETGVQSIHLNTELQESLDLKVVEVERKKLKSSLEVYGSIAQDTENTTHVTAKAPCTLKSFKTEVGQTVEKDEAIATAITQDQKTVDILSPCHGIVMAQYVKEGEKVDSLTSIATIANPDLLRASFDVYEKDTGFVKMGQEVEIKSIAYPGKKFSSKIVFISPRVDDETRTIKIRADVKNEDHLLKFGMSVTGSVLREAETSSIVIPLESVQQIGDEWTVFVKTGEETFEVRPILKGKETDEEVEILEGLKESETIAAKGSFTLKAEAMKAELGEGGHEH